MKKLLAIISILLLGTLLVSCGGEKPSKPNDNNEVIQPSKPNDNNEVIQVTDFSKLENSINKLNSLLAEVNNIEFSNKLGNLKEGINASLEENKKVDTEKQPEVDAKVTKAEADLNKFNTLFAQYKKLNAQYKLIPAEILVDEEEEKYINDIVLSYLDEEEKENFKLQIQHQEEKNYNIVLILKSNENVKDSKVIKVQKDNLAHKANEALNEAVSLIKSSVKFDDGITPVSIVKIIKDAVKNKQNIGVKLVKFSKAEKSVTIRVYQKDNPSVAQIVKFVLPEKEEAEKVDYTAELQAELNKIPDTIELPKKSKEELKNAVEKLVDLGKVIIDIDGFTNYKVELKSIHDHKQSVKKSVTVVVKDK